MGVRLKNVPMTADIHNDPSFGDSTIEQRETTVDGQTFHWGPGQVRNFADDGVGLKHAAQLGNASVVLQDAIPFGTSRS